MNPDTGHEQDRTGCEEQRTMYFIGVTTGSSSINRLFPLWAEILDLRSVRLVGVDLALHAPAEQYRQIVTKIRDDPCVAGAAITAHKIDLFAATAGMFDELDEYAEICYDVSCISKRGGRLIGHANEPITAGKALHDMLGTSYWPESGGHVLCLGAGGSGTAIAAHLHGQYSTTHGPQRLFMVSRSQPALDRLHRVLDRLPTSNMRVDYMLNEDAASNDRLLAELPSGSLVVNATGMGKDRPGSPISHNAIFPERGIVWELNYRGQLDFLRQALSQQQERKLRVFDGWRFFVTCWSEHIATIFDRTIPRQRFEQLVRSADAIRGA